MRRMLQAGLLAVCVGVSFDAVAQPLVSTPQDRNTLAVTIYNNGIGLVRETRRIDLPKGGRVRLDFRGVAPTINAASVALVAVGDPRALQVVEQAYRYDVLSPSVLTARAAGLPITLHRTHPGSGQVVPVPGTALADFTGMNPVLRTREGITFYGGSRAIGFGTLPDRWVSEPMLSWQLDARRAGMTTIDVSYLAGAMRWSADYIFVLGKQAKDPATLVGWITLVNNSGASFDNAHLAVVAGKVHLTDERDEMEGGGGLRASALKRAPEAPVAQRSTLSEYHQYDIPNSTSLPDRSSKQVTFLLSNAVRPTTRYVVDPRWWRSGGVRAGTGSKEVAQTEIRFDAKADQGLGVPMPAGMIRVFTHDSQGQPQFVGQTAIDHTPKDETVKLRIGPASEIRLYRKLMDRTRELGRSKDTVTYQLRNAKPVPVAVDVVERAGKLDHATIPATHPDAATTMFTVEVPAGGEVTWRAEYTEDWR